MISDSESGSGSGSARVGLLAYDLAVAGCIGPGLPILELDVVGGELLSVVVLDGDMTEPCPEMLVCDWSLPDPRIHLQRGHFFNAKPLLILIIF